MKLNFGVNQCTLISHVISQAMEYIRMTISQHISKIETSGLGHEIIVCKKASWSLNKFYWLLSHSVSCGYWLDSGLGGGCL